jgi:hypothetical protein
MPEVWRRLIDGRRNLLIVAAVTILYLIVFLLSVGDLALEAGLRSVSVNLVGDWRELILRQRVPFQFEAVAVVSLPGAIWLLSPANLAIGLILGGLTGLQIALIGVARQCARACGLHPASGLISGLPGLLAGSACCAPVLFVLLGFQVTAAAVTTMSLMIPAAFVLLLAGLYVTARIAAQRCSEFAA